MAAKKTQSKNFRKTASPALRPVGLRLHRKVAVITGASRGIGFAIAKAFAAEGCNVVICGRDQVSLTKSAAQIQRSAATRRAVAKILPVICDVRQEDSVTDLFSAVEKTFGGIDVLVNNAGITQPTIPIVQTSLELWRNVLDTNLTGMFLCTRAALGMMRQGGTIVNNLSAAARQVFPNYASYSAAKRGALGFTLSLREELIPRGIRVMALIPGATATNMWDEIMPGAPRERMIDPESVAKTVLHAVLLPPNVNVSEMVLDPTCGGI